MPNEPSFPAPAPWNKIPSALVDEIMDAVAAGEKISHIAAKYDITRQAIYKWLAETATSRRALKDVVFTEKIEKIIQKVLNEAETKDLDSVSMRDLAIIGGVFLDKRKELVGPKPPAAQAAMRLKVTWADGSGSITSLDLETSSSTTSPCQPDPSASTSPSSDFDDTAVDVESYTISDEEAGADIHEPIDCGLDDEDPRGWGEGPERKD